MSNFIEHPLLKKNSIEGRLYQEMIVASAVQKNTLCILPTGLGKTAVAALVAAHRLNKEKGKVLFMAPTRPLVEQHRNTFTNFFSIPEEVMITITGTIAPEERELLWKSATLAFATPQTVKNDIEENRIDLNKFSLIIFDETHRAVGDYAYPFVAKNYMEQNTNPLILGLTASPGGNKEKIQEICENLFIENVELRTEDDDDVKPYVKEVNVEWRKVKLTSEYKKLIKSVKKAQQKQVDYLKDKDYLSTDKKSDLIKLQKDLIKRAKAGEPHLFGMVSVTAEAIKLEHALDMLETQGISAFLSYIKKMESQKNKASDRILSNPIIKRTVKKSAQMNAEGIEHPKLEEMKGIILTTLRENPDSKIIVFSHFRDMVSKLEDTLSEIDGCKPVTLVGQSRGGMTQQEQIERIEEFEENKYNTLICTSIGEEGLHLSSADIAVFYEPVASEIRSIQRRGRVGRTKVGKIYILMAEDTRDVAYYWSAKNKEKKMKSYLNKIKQTDKLEFGKQKNLKDF